MNEITIILIKTNARPFTHLRYIFYQIFYGCYLFFFIIPRCSKDFFPSVRCLVTQISLTCVYRPRFVNRELKTKSVVNFFITRLAPTTEKH